MTIDSRFATRVLAAAATVLYGTLHLYLWDKAYRFLPVREEFLAVFAASLVVGLVLLIGFPRRLSALACFGLGLGSLIAFGLSRGPGVPTPHGLFTETGLQSNGVSLFGANIDVITLIAEGVATVLGAVLLVAILRPAAPAQAR